MDRNFTQGEISVLIKFCIETQTDLLPYCCRENFDAWWSIARRIGVVKKYNITPECYWHGDYTEFTQLLILLADGYPSPKELLKAAEKKTTGEIKNIANHFYQYIIAMFDYVKTHHGYVVLKPTAYMQSLYPHSKDMLYVYTSEKWTHNESSGIDKAVLALKADEIGSLQKLLRAKLGIL